MFSLNKVLLVGNVVKTPELREAQSGRRYTTVRLACNERISGVDYTEFVDLKFFGKMAEVVCQYAVKGQMLWADGRLSTYEYETKDGVRTWRTQVIVQDFKFISGGKKRNLPDETKPHSEDSGENPSFDQDEEIPF